MENRRKSDWLVTLVNREDENKIFHLNTKSYPFVFCDSYDELESWSDLIGEFGNVYLIVSLDKVFENKDGIIELSKKMNIHIINSNNHDLAEIRQLLNHNFQLFNSPEEVIKDFLSKDPYIDPIL